MSDFLAHEEAQYLLQGTTPEQSPELVASYEFTKNQIAELESLRAKCEAQAKEIRSLKAGWQVDLDTVITQAERIKGLEKDAARLDWLEQEVKSSRTGVSINYSKLTEEGYVVEQGYRVIRFHNAGEFHKTSRSAIDAAMKEQS